MLLLLRHREELLASLFATWTLHVTLLATQRNGSPSLIEECAQNVSGRKRPRPLLIGTSALGSVLENGPSCSICGSYSTWEDGWVAAECEHRQGNQSVNPNAIRVRSRILVLMDSTRPLERPESSA